MIVLNTIILSDLNLLTLSHTLLLICRLDHIQNLTFHALINFGFIHYLINSIFILKHNISTKPNLPVKLKLFNRLLNNIITETTSISIAFLFKD